jgi:hypothetical protein
MYLITEALFVYNRIHSLRVSIKILNLKIFVESKTSSYAPNTFSLSVNNFILKMEGAVPPQVGNHLKDYEVPWSERPQSKSSLP